MFERSLESQLRFDSFRRWTKEAKEPELREAVLLLAEQAFLQHPAALNFLAKEATQNLATQAALCSACPALASTNGFPENP